MSVNPPNKTLIVIAGPTASGKTALSIAVASHFGAEIVSADSRQFYREMNIGTAKPGSGELDLIRHHFINSHSITEEYDAASFGKDALERINILFTESNFVVLCGGSGLYIKAVLEGFDHIPEVDPSIRRSLISRYESKGLAWLQEELRQIDPEHYERIDRQNPQRLIRALEVRLGTGFSIAHFQQKAGKPEHPFRIVRIGLQLPRQELYSRIDQRMDEMIARGLFDEAAQLYPFRQHNALQTVGYQEIFDFMEGKYDRTEAVRLLKRNSRRYAKRQLTWFARDHDIVWFSPDQQDEIIGFIHHQCH